MLSSVDLCSCSTDQKLTQQQQQSMDQMNKYSWRSQQVSFLTLATIDDWTVGVLYRRPTQMRISGFIQSTTAPAPTISSRSNHIWKRGIRLYAEMADIFYVFSSCQCNKKCSAPSDGNLPTYVRQSYPPLLSVVLLLGGVVVVLWWWAATPGINDRAVVPGRAFNTQLCSGTLGQ